MTSKNKDEKEKPEQVAPEILRAILQEGVDFKVTANHPNILHRIGMLPTERTFMVYPICLGVLFHISKLILSMATIDVEKEDDYFDAGLKSIIANRGKMVRILSLAIINREPTLLYPRIKRWILERYLTRNLDPHETLKLLNLVITQMDVTDFLASIASVKKLNLVGATNTKAQSTIGKSSAE